MVSTYGFSLFRVRPLLLPPLDVFRPSDATQESHFCSFFIWVRYLSLSFPWAIRDGTVSHLPPFVRETLTLGVRLLCFTRTTYRVRCWTEVEVGFGDVPTVTDIPCELNSTVVHFLFSRRLSVSSDRQQLTSEYRDRDRVQVFLG